MKTKSNPRKDFTQVAFAVMQQATGETEPEKELTGKKADSSKGGKAGGKARAEKLSPDVAKKISNKN